MSEDDIVTADVTPGRESVAQSLAGHLRDERGRRYETQRELARGGMGVVEQIVDPPLRRTLARKRARADIEASELAHLLVAVDEV